MKYIVELEPGVFICETDGDPGRTLVRKNAQVFKDMRAAGRALTAAREYRPFANASFTGAGEDASEK